MANLPTPQYADLGLPLIHAGKVRELYDLGDQLLMVATDNISAFDHVLSDPIPDKGVVLTQLSLWWFDRLGLANHVISTDVPEAVAGRAVICEKLQMLPIECVARGYLTGSGWAEYRQHRSVCGISLPEGLYDGARLAAPIFTPAAKAELGEHDENVDFAAVVETVGQERADELRDRTLEIYAVAERIARDRGIILADTKFEFGVRPDGSLVLADEVLTPDSSRFWDGGLWRDGQLVSFDKQFLRDWLLHESGWDRTADAPPPPLPESVISATRDRYLAAYRRITGSALSL